MRFAWPTHGVQKRFQIWQPKPGRVPSPSRKPFAAVDAGGLDESWRQQPGTPVYTEDFDADGVQSALAKATKDRTPEWHATNNSPGSFTAPA